MEITRAKTEESDKVVAFYHDLINQLRDDPYFPDWEIGVYPLDESLVGSIQNRNLWLCRENGHILGAMVLDHHSGEEYDTVTWGKSIPRGSYSVIHTLCVDPAAQGKGVAKAMVHHALNTAKSRGDLAVRLDVLKGNDPAAKLYTGCGFHYVNTIQIIYDDKSVPEFLLYEYNF